MAAACLGKTACTQLRHSHRVYPRRRIKHGSTRRTFRPRTVCKRIALPCQARMGPQLRRHTLAADQAGLENGQLASSSCGRLARGKLWFWQGALPALMPAHPAQVLRMPSNANRHLCCWTNIPDCGDAQRPGLYFDVFDGLVVVAVDELPFLRSEALQIDPAFIVMAKYAIGLFGVN